MKYIHLLALTTHGRKVSVASMLHCSPTFTKMAQIHDGPMQPLAFLQIQIHMRENAQRRAHTQVFTTSQGVIKC